MVEIVFVSSSVRSLLHYVEVGEFRQYDMQQSAAVHLHQSFRRCLRAHDFVHLFLNPLSRDYSDAFFVSFESVESLVVDKEVELCGEPYASHHSERVVRESDVRVERRPHDAVFEVVDAVEWVNKLAEAFFVQTDSHCVDGEIASVLVVFECSVFYNGLSRVVAVAFFSCPYKLYLPSVARFVVDAHLCRAEVLEDREFGASAYLLFHCFGNVYPAADDNDVDIV